MVRFESYMLYLYRLIFRSQGTLDDVDGTSSSPHDRERSFSNEDNLFHSPIPSSSRADASSQSRQCDTEQQPSSSQQSRHATVEEVEDEGDTIPTPAVGGHAPHLRPVLPEEDVEVDIDLPSAEEIFNRDCQLAKQFIEHLQQATLDNDALDEDTRAALRNAPTETLGLDDPNLQLSLRLYLALENASEDAYAQVCAAIAQHPGSPEANMTPLSYSRIKRRVSEITGIKPIYTDMCIDTCVAFTGPFAELEQCPLCGKARFEENTRKPCQQFATFPVGPMLQASRRHPQTAKDMNYRRDETEKLMDNFSRGVLPTELNDYLHGSEYLEAVERGDVGKNDFVLLYTIDGAQLFRSKLSDCWIYVWVLLDRAHDVRDRKDKVLIGGIIPGPQAPKNLDSFIYPGFHHLAALMHDGISIWDAESNEKYTSYPYLAMVTADGPAMAKISGRVGHMGKKGCRYGCPQAGRRKPRGKQYNPACLKPDNYDVPGCDHEDINLCHQPDDSEPRSQDEVTARYRRELQALVSATSTAAYEQLRLNSGIVKPSILSGLPADRIFPLPGCFPGDLMHLIALNNSELWLGLWRGTIACDPKDSIDTWDWAVLTGDTWIAHGAEVAEAARPHFPNSFDCPPRNPAEKLNSGYKAWESLMYLFGLGPGLLYGILPDKYWQHFCKLVQAVRIIHQHRVTVDQLIKAHELIISFCEEFEQLYCQRKATRLHFVRQSVHSLIHLAPESFRLGPFAIYAQWTMERTIGDLGRQIHQPSNPYANLSHRALYHCQRNTLHGLIPDLKPSSKPSTSRNAVKLEQYTLLHKAEKIARTIPPEEAAAIRQYFADPRGSHITVSEEWLEQPRIAKWARLWLPNGQIARSRWAESSKPLHKLRISRNVKVRCDT